MNALAAPSPLDQRLRDRFFAKTRRASNGCLEWTASCRRPSPRHQAYGQFGLRDGMIKKAHRVAWWLNYGRWPAAACLHACDNPICVEVEHLFEGTNQDNIDDMMRKGRQARGEMKVKSAKLIASQALEIRRLCAAGRTQQSIANKFDVSTRNVRMIRDRKTWSHI